MNIKNKILNQSNSYKYYKDNYEKYKIEYETLLRNYTNIERKYLDIEKKINSIIHDVTKNQDYFELEINKMELELDNRNEKIKDLEKSYEMSLLNKEKKFNSRLKEILDEKNEIDKKIQNEINNSKEHDKNINIALNKKTNELNALNKQVIKLKHELNYKNEHLNKINNDLTELNAKIKNLSKELDNKNNEIRNLRKPFTNFDEYLIESYIFPLVRPPFSEEAKRCFSVMEEVASYLISKVEILNEQPLISVIMPVYNRKDVVMMAINSVLSQTYENFELIVVDDASTDGTTELLKTINHDKVKVVFHEKNKYASGARNTGLKHSKGKYIAYLDSDNLLDERYLAATVGAFLELPDAGGIYSAQYRYETYDSKPFAIQFGSLNKSLLHNHNFVDMNCFAHRRDVYENIGGFDETLKGADDWELILKISNNYKIYSVPFLLSKCYLGVVDNRVSDLVPTDMGKIRSQNEKLPTSAGKLETPVTIIIPIFESINKLKNCINNILKLYDDNVNIIISNSNPEIDIINFLKEFESNSKIKIIHSSKNHSFVESLNQGISASNENTDILILHQDAILTEGSLESLQKHAYNLKDCGLTVSQQVLKNGTAIKSHVPYAHDDYWCDITPSNFYKNILRVPIFHNGEYLELKMAPFFCTYIKREILLHGYEFNINLGSHFHSMRLFSEYVRHILGLKIYHISEAIVIHNASEEYRNKKPIQDYNFNYKQNKKNENTESELYIWNF